MTDTVSRKRAEHYRFAFLSAFSFHDQLDEREADLYEVENEPENGPDDITLQRVIAAYEQVHVWLLNEDGPLQAYYDTDGTWGMTGDADEVADEIEQRLNL